MKATARAALIGTAGPFVLRHGLAADPICIGVVSPASGNNADHGMMERLGMTIAAEEYKDKDVLGRPVKLIVVDETDPQVWAGKARRRKLENAPGWTPGPEETDRPGGGRTEGRNCEEPETAGTLPPAGWGCQAEEGGL